MSSDGSSLDDQLLREVPVSVVDLEMTGLSATHDRICEVAVVCGDAGEVRREVHSLVRPAVPVSPGALACHGLTEDLLADAPPFSDVAETVADAIEERALIAHNVPFDLGFLEKEMGEAGHRFPPPVTLDTLVMARRLISQMNQVMVTFRMTVHTHLHTQVTCRGTVHTHTHTQATCRGTVHTHTHTQVTCRGTVHTHTHTQVTCRMISLPLSAGLQSSMRSVAASLSAEEASLRILLRRTIRMSAEWIRLRLRGLE